MDRINKNVVKIVFLVIFVLVCISVSTEEVPCIENEQLDLVTNIVGYQSQQPSLQYVIGSEPGKANCMMGKYCDRCSAGHFKIVNVEYKEIKVCCPDCNKYCDAGYRPSDGRPFCTCRYPEDIKGDCWKGEQCEICLNGPNSTSVGRINALPVCCAHCESSGLMIAGHLCNCLHNGP